MANSKDGSSVTIRRALPEDAPIAGGICYEAFAAINGQHRFPSDVPSTEAGIGLLRMMFSHPGFYAVVAESDGQVVGSNCLDERSAIAGVGPITVSTAAQNRSIGRMLMQAVIDRAHERNAPGVRLLQAAFHNRSLSLYTKLGFDAREPISVMQGAPIQSPLESHTVRTATIDDLRAANRICEQVHGHNRSGELQESVSQGTAVVVEKQGRLTGYSSHLGFFGHTVSESNEDLQAIIAQAPVFSGPGILVPTRNAALLRWCLEHGLRVVYPMTLMTMGLYNEPRGAYLPSIAY